MARRKFGDLIILLPGITGSVLQKNGKDVWAITPQSAISALFTLGGSIKDLEIRGKDDPSKDDLGDGVTAPRLVQDLHLIPGLWAIDGYTQIKTRLFAELTLEEGKNWFDYPYDWRRDNRVHGRQLADRAPKWLAAWKKASGNQDAKLVLLAHSMGGLVARDFLERHDGWKITRHLITFGTPYRGSLNAVTTLVNGMDKGFGPISVDLSGLLRSFPSMHQLLPIYPSVEMGGTSSGRVRRRSPGSTRPRPPTPCASIAISRRRSRLIRHSPPIATAATRSRRSSASSSRRTSRRGWSATRSRCSRAWAARTWAATAPCPASRPPRSSCPTPRARPMCRRSTARSRTPRRRCPMSSAPSRASA
ncbi:MAG: hypothetical protein IPO93_02795 [Actinobacteria bacterium]|nr:hypothetical protein [Actinomycetota bacterium]